MITTKRQTLVSGMIAVLCGACDALGAPPRAELEKLAAASYGTKYSTYSMYFGYLANKDPQRCQRAGSFESGQNVTYLQNVLGTVVYRPSLPALTQCLLDNKLLERRTVEKKIYECSKEEHERIWNLQYNDPNHELPAGDGVERLRAVESLLAKLGDRTYEDTPVTKEEVYLMSPQLFLLKNSMGFMSPEARGPYGDLSFITARFSVGKLLAVEPAGNGMYRARFQVTAQRTELAKCAPSNNVPVITTADFLFVRQFGKWTVAR